MVRCRACGACGTEGAMCTVSTFSTSTVSTLGTFSTFTTSESSTVSERSNSAVSLRSAIPIELPGVADLLDHVEIEVGDDQFVLVAAGFGDEASARIAEVALAVELADVPRRLGPDAVDRADEIAVRHRVRGLLELPEILREARDRRRRIEHDLGPVQPEDARPFRGLPVVAAVDPDLAD